MKSASNKLATRQITLVTLWCSLGLITSPLFGMGQAQDISKALTIGIFSEQNTRDHMEDMTVSAVPINAETPSMALLAVCDGHAGALAAKIAGQRLPQLFAQLLPPLAEDLNNCKAALAALGKDLVDARNLITKRIVVAHRDISQAIHFIFAKVEKELEQEADTSGTTAVTACLWRGNEETNLCVANLGDSRCIVGDRSGNVKFETEDHKPSSPREKRRILDASRSIVEEWVVELPPQSPKEQAKYYTRYQTTNEYGSQLSRPQEDPDWNEINFSATFEANRKSFSIVPELIPVGYDDETRRALRLPTRVGGFSVSRTLGDRSAKTNGYPIIAEPDIPSSLILEQDNFLILASDGLLDVMSSHEATNIASRILFGANDSGTPSQRCRQAADCLGNMAMERGSDDNISIIVALNRTPPQEQIAAPQSAPKKRTVRKKRLYASEIIKLEQAAEPQADDEFKQCISDELLDTLEAP